MFCAKRPCDWGSLTATACLLDLNLLPYQHPRRLSQPRPAWQYFSGTRRCDMPIQKKGWEILIKRVRQEKRKGQAFARTISTYRVFHDGTPVHGLSGDFVERQGPGDNTRKGKTAHSRIA